MAKIPFDIKYRPQIESGEYKVETRSGLPARIVCWDRKTKDMEILALVYNEHIEEDNEDIAEVALNGKMFPRGKNHDYDLFIVTPEEELTEFEIRLLDWLSNDTSGEIPIERMKEVARNRAAELRSLVREEFENEAPSIIEAQSFREGFKVGKAEALRDLPRWKTWGNGACGSSSGLPIAIVKASVSGGYLLVPSLGIGGEQYIMLSDLEKLPKEG